MTVCRLRCDILETELDERSMTNRMDLSAEINQDLFLCIL